MGKPELAKLGSKQKAELNKLFAAWQNMTLGKTDGENLENPEIIAARNKYYAKCIELGAHIALFGGKPTIIKLSKSKSNALKSFVHGTTKNPSREMHKEKPGANTLPRGRLQLHRPY